MIQLKKLLVKSIKPLPIKGRYTITFEGPYPLGGETPEQRADLLDISAKIKHLSYLAWDNQPINLNIEEVQITMPGFAPSPAPAEEASHEP